MPPAGFEPAISASDQQQAYALDRSATGVGSVELLIHYKDEQQDRPKVSAKTATPARIQNKYSWNTNQMFFISSYNSGCVIR